MKPIVGIVSKADIIRGLRGMSVLDIGGCGYGEDNAYERELREAWSGTIRTVVDAGESADIRCDINGILPSLPQSDVVTIFDTLEHLENPANLLRSLAGREIIATVPNAISPITRAMERRWSMGLGGHLHSYTPDTLRNLFEVVGYRVVGQARQCGRHSLAAKVLYGVCSCAPSLATGLIIHANAENQALTRERQ